MYATYVFSDACTTWVVLLSCELRTLRLSSLCERFINGSTLVNYRYKRSTYLRRKIITNYLLRTRGKFLRSWLLFAILQTLNSDLHWILCQWNRLTLQPIQQHHGRYQKENAGDEAGKGKCDGPSRCPGTEEPGSRKKGRKGAKTPAFRSRSVFLQLFF